MQWVILWIFLCFVAAIIAGNKGRSGFGFFVLALLLSPLIGIIAALLASPNTAQVEKSLLESGTNKKCPHCAEIIKIEAKVCRYCGRDLPELHLISAKPTPFQNVEGNEPYSPHVEKNMRILRRVIDRDPLARNVARRKH